MASDQIPTFSVSDFVASLNQTLEYTYPTIEVEGEVSSFKVNQNKWVFFDLKDESSTVGCFMSVFNLRVPIEDGMKVIVRATPKVATWGKFNLTIQSIRPSGEGSLRKSFELLKSKLEKEGLFALDRKRPLPQAPTHIAVISSTQAAGYADFIKILNERSGGVKVDVAHVQVQGVVAAEQIVRAVNYFNELEVLPEVLVIIRGGGSADELSTFNDEPLVRAIAASRIPTLVGVGHEIDETLADLAADVRAATPSNAAQIVVPDRREQISELHLRVGLVLSHMERAVAEFESGVRHSLERSFTVIESQLESTQSQLVNYRQVIAAYDPRSVLARGYAIVRGTISPGQTIEIERKSDKIIAEVTDVRSTK